MLYPGTNYISQPVITIQGGNGTGGRAHAVMKNALIRNIKTTLVYDRYTYGTTVLTWSTNTPYYQGNIVAYNGTAYIVNQNFTSSSTFNSNYMSVYPADKFSTANDRIEAYYQPEIGQPGRDFGLLESGIDYPGVTVNGPLYTESSGFDVTGFDSTVFDPLEIDSDGTYVISDAILDTVITSDYTDSSLGIRPEDIIVDGGPFVYDTFTTWTANTYYDRGDIVSYNDRFWYTVQSYTSNSAFSTDNLTIYNIGPYASHAPEELIPGRVFDTLDMTVYTIAADPQSTSYQNWLTNSGLVVDYIEIADPGAGYSLGEVGVGLDGGGYTTIALAQVTIGANGSATGFTVFDSGTGYHTTPNVIIIGANSKPIVASAVMKLSNAPSSSYPYPLMAYRIFKDMNDQYTYLRLDGAATTTLANDVAINDTVIYVTDASVLPEPAPQGAEPGVVLINGERITYYSKDNDANTITQLRRGTAGTGAQTHTAGDQVVDGSFNQIVYQSSNYNYTYSSNTANITVRYTGTINTSLTSNVVTGTSTIFTKELNAGNKLYDIGGNLIGTVATVISSNSAVLTANSLVTLSSASFATYTVFASNTTYTRSNLWYTLGTGAATNQAGLFNANTLQASFLREGLIS